MSIRYQLDSSIGLLSMKKEDRMYRAKRSRTFCAETTLYKTPCTRGSPRRNSKPGNNDILHKFISQIARCRAIVKLETTSLACVGVQKGKGGLIRRFCARHAVDNVTRCESRCPCLLLMEANPILSFSGSSLTDPWLC